MWLCDGMVHGFAREFRSSWDMVAQETREWRERGSVPMSAPKRS